MNDRSIRMYMSTTIEVAGLTVMLKLVGMPVYMQDRAVCNHRMLSRGRLLWQVAMHGGGGIATVPRGSCNGSRGGCYGTTRLASFPGRNGKRD